MTGLTIPESLTKAIIFLRGDNEGRAWLAALPRRITAYARRWDLTPEAIAEGGAMSCCVLCTTHTGTRAVLKIPLDHLSGRSEVRLLQRWAATGATPAVLHSAASAGVFLMERITPGTTAWAGQGPDDSRHFLDLLTKLNPPGLPIPPRYQDIKGVAEMRLDWARERFADPRYTNDIASIKDAELVLEALIRTTRTRHLLHADLQAKNVLTGHDNQWFAIDPFGAIGDLNAEAALWAAIQDSPTTIEDRLLELDSTLLDPNRLKAWTFVFATAEYRPYLPEPAQRIRDFLADTNVVEILSLITDSKPKPGR